MTHCGYCHGAGSGGVPDLDYMSARTHAQFENIVRIAGRFRAGCGLFRTVDAGGRRRRSASSWPRGPRRQEQFTRGERSTARKREFQCFRYQAARVQVAPCGVFAQIACHGVGELSLGCSLGYAQRPGRQHAARLHRYDGVHDAGHVATAVAAVEIVVGTAVKSRLPVSKPAWAASGNRARVSRRRMASPAVGQVHVL